MNRQKGFTLLELLTTVGVATVLVSVAVPSFTNLTLNSRRASSINELVGALHFARNSAVTRNERVTVCASSNGTACAAVGWNEGWVVFADGNGNQSVDFGETVFRAGAEVQGISVVSSEFPNFFIYRPNGRVMGAAAATNSGDFTICDRRGAEYANVVIVDMSGRPRLSKTMIDGSDPSCPAV
jgi:type IV fimbrial biogenesis protein FimT